MITKVIAFDMVVSIVYNSMKGYANMSKEYLTIQELADELNVHFNTAYRYVTRGYVKSYRMGKTYRISMEELENIKKNGVPLVRKE